MSADCGTVQYIFIYSQLARLRRRQNDEQWSFYSRNTTTTPASRVLSRESDGGCQRRCKLPNKGRKHARRKVASRRSPICLSPSSYKGVLLGHFTPPSASTNLAHRQAVLIMTIATTRTDNGHTPLVRVLVIRQAIY